MTKHVLACNQYCKVRDCSELCSYYQYRKVLFRSHDETVPWIVPGMTFASEHISDEPSFKAALLRVLGCSIAMNLLLSTSHINVQAPPRVIRNYLVRSLTSRHIGLPKDHQVLRVVVARILLYVGYLWRAVRPLLWPLLWAQILLHLVCPNRIFRKFTFETRE